MKTLLQLDRLQTRLLITLLFIGILSLVSGFFLLAFPVNASSELIAYFPFDGDTNDHSGYGYDGTVSGGTYSDGLKEQALELDGIDDFISVPLNINPDNFPGLSITAWVRASRSSGIIVSQDDGGYDRQLGIDNRGGGLGWSAFCGTGGVLGYHPVDTGEWVFLAVVYDQPSGQVCLYVNDQMYEKSGTLSSGTNTLSIGRSASFGTYFKGEIDDLRIYGSALTPEDINTIYQNDVAPVLPERLSSPVMVVHYPFDHDLVDYSGYGNDGIEMGNIDFVPGPVDNAARFDGQSFIKVPDSGSLDLYNGFTIAAWIFRENAGTGGWSVLLSKGDSSYLDNRSPYALAHTIDGLKPLVRLVNNNNYTLMNSDHTADFNEWYYLTVTWDGQTVSFYTDGVLRDTASWSGTLPNSSADLLIGCDPPGSTEYFIGMIDELRIFNYALSENEITTLYKEGEIPASGITNQTPEPTETSEDYDNPASGSLPDTTSLVISSGSLIFESRSMETGSEVQIPITLENANEKIGNIDLTLRYDPEVLTVLEAIKGGFTSNSIFDFNIVSPGTVKISLADTIGFGGNTGSVAYVKFKVIGETGAVSNLQISSSTINRAEDAKELDFELKDGVFTVISEQEGRGDYDGDSKWTTLDALVALQMAVGKRVENLRMDINSDGKVTSLDAREILKSAISRNQREITESNEIISVRSLSTDQQRIVAMFGWPHSFTLLEIEVNEGEYRCSETWTYYDGQTRYYFIDGEYQDWEPVESLPEGSIATPYRPDEFVLGSNKTSVKQVISSEDEWSHVQESGFLFEDVLDSAEIYAAPQLLTGFHQDRLVFLEALALVPVENE